MGAHGVGEALPQALFSVGGCGRPPCEEWCGGPVPPAIRGPTIADGQGLPGQKLGDSVEEAQWIRHIAGLEIEGRGAWVHDGDDPRAPKQGLELGAEDEPSRRVGVVEWLDAEAVTRQQQGPTTSVPHGKGEHAAQTLDTALA